VNAFSQIDTCDMTLQHLTTEDLREFIILQEGSGYCGAQDLTVVGRGLSQARLLESYRIFTKLFANRPVRFLVFEQVGSLPLLEQGFKPRLPLCMGLVKLRASYTTGCAHCIDMHTTDARS
jgi:hypothetical protein